MRDDGPTVPNLRQYERYDQGERGGIPPWPETDARAQRTSRRGRSAVLGVSLALSLGANVALLIALLVLLALSRAGYFSPLGSSTPSTTPSASGNATPAPSPTASSGWLQVAPAEAHVGCDNGQQTQYVVLVNSGSEDIEWQAQFSIPSDQAAVVVSPRQGVIRAGTSLILKIQIRTRIGAQTGEIRFNSDTSAAGSPPTLTYTTVNCQ